MKYATKDYKRDIYNELKREEKVWAMCADEALLLAKNAINKEEANTYYNTYEKYISKRDAIGDVISTLSSKELI